MANVSRPSGFRAVSNRDGSDYAGRMRGVIFLVGDSTATFIGDMLKYTGEQKQGFDGKFYSVVTRAAAADTRLAGALQRVQDLASDNGYVGFRKASTLQIGYIPADRNCLYAIQEDGNMTADAAEANVDFVVGSGDTTTYQSGTLLDSGTVDTTGALPIRLVEYEATIDNEEGSLATWIVTINQDAYINTTGLAV